MSEGCSKSGTSLTDIWKNPTSTSLAPNHFGHLQNALSNYEWDAITLQPHPGTDVTLETEVGAITGMIDLLRSGGRNAGTQVYIYAAWPGLTQAGKTYSDFWNAPLDDPVNPEVEHTKAFYNLLIETLHRDVDSTIKLIPAGWVVEEIDAKIRAGQLPGLDSLAGDFYRDVLHLDRGVGRYTMSMLVFSSLYGVDPRELDPIDGSFPPSWDPSGMPISPELDAILAETLIDVTRSVPDAVALVPEPTTGLLIGAATVLLGFRRRR